MRLFLILLIVWAGLVSINEKMDTISQQLSTITSRLEQNRESK